jgi:hypothetical protein
MKGGAMPLKDLSGKDIYDLNPEEVEEHFCRYCRENEECLRTERDIHICRGLIDSGLWDKHYRKLTD